MTEIDLSKKNFQVKHKGKDYNFEAKELTGYENDQILQKASKIEVIDGKAKVSVDNPELKKQIFLHSIEKVWVNNVEYKPEEVFDKLAKNIYEEVHKVIEKLNSSEENF